MVAVGAATAEGVMGAVAGEDTAGVVGVGEAAVVDVGSAATGSGGSSLSIVAAAVTGSFIRFAAGSGASAVSYTHLDVYKRQLFDPRKSVQA